LSTPIRAIVSPVCRWIAWRSVSELEHLTRDDDPTLRTARTIDQRLDHRINAVGFELYES
jgi:hypothetical protein